MMAEVQIYSGGVTPPRQPVGPTTRPPGLTNTQAESTTGEDRATMTNCPRVVFRADLYPGRTILTLRLPRQLNLVPVKNAQRTDAGLNEGLVGIILDPTTRRAVQDIFDLSDQLHALRLTIFPDCMVQVVCNPVVQLRDGMSKIESGVRRIAQICYKSAGIDCTDDDILLIKEKDLPRQ